MRERVKETIEKDEILSTEHRGVNEYESGYAFKFAIGYRVRTEYSKHSTA